jgi:hypothetical protein
MAACLLTYERTEYAVRTVQSVCRNLQYENLAWYIADDGSRPEHVSEIVSALEAENAKIFGSHSERLGPGPSWNLAIEKSLEQADFILWLEDDWELSVDLQVEPYVKLMQEVPKVGMGLASICIRSAMTEFIICGLKNHSRTPIPETRVSDTNVISEPMTGIRNPTNQIRANANCGTTII